MNQNQEKKDKYIEILENLSGKIRYSKIKRMIDDYNKVDESYQKDKITFNNDLFRTIALLSISIVSLLVGNHLWQIQEKIMGFLIYTATAGATLGTYVHATFLYHSAKKHRQNKRLISKIERSFKKECHNDPSIMQAYNKHKVDIEYNRQHNNPDDIFNIWKKDQDIKKPTTKENNFTYNPQKKHDEEDAEAFIKPYEEYFGNNSKEEHRGR